jgi:Domain of unknown function (DUF222)
MFENPSGLDVEGLRAVVRSLADLDQGVDEAVRIDRVRVLEELKSAASAAQARETAAFAAARRASSASEKPRVDPARGIAGEIGLARRVSPYNAARYVGWSTVLTGELPRTLAALRDGRVSEWRAMIVARETAWLSREHRREVDRLLAPDLERFGDRRVEAEAKKLAYRLDPEGYVGRVRGAKEDRRVTLRPAPDAMARLTALLPVEQGVAAYAALMREAATCVGVGDERGRGQIMADALVQRVTGQAVAGDVPVEVNLVMTDRTLFGFGIGDGGNEPAHLDGYGPIPADYARRLVLEPSDTTPMWIRRLYNNPTTDQLIAMESRRRNFPAAQRRFLRIRDQYCRTPWCDAPIRHIDHVARAAGGGGTTTDNGQGYCEACNYAKETPGWRASVVALNPHEVEIRTPTGHRYRSRAPGLPGRSRTKSELVWDFAALQRVAC